MSSYTFCHGARDNDLFSHNLVVSCETSKSCKKKAVLHLALQHIERILDRKANFLLISLLFTKSYNLLDISDCGFMYYQTRELFVSSRETEVYLNINPTYNLQSFFSKTLP